MNPWRIPRRVTGAGAMLLLIAALTACNTQADTAGAQPSAPRVSVADVIVREVQLWDEYTGRIEAVESVELRPRVSGHIERINFREGQEVDRGDVLFVIDQRPYQVAVALAEADLLRARSRAELAQTEAERAERMADTRAISLEELDRRRAAASQARAEMHAARAALDAARLELEYTEVRAPIAGRAGRAQVTVGNLVTGQGNGTPLTTIVSLDPVHIHFFADEHAYLHYEAMARSGDLASTRENGTPVRVGLLADEGYPHPGTVNFVDNRLDSGTGTVLIRAELANAERQFVPGMFARARIPGSGTFTAKLVDPKAILTDQDRKYVYVVDDNGRALRRDVTTGRMVDGLRIIHDGLAPNDRVVVNGTQRIFFPGMPVEAELVTMDATTTP